jgi:menaquinone-dependent protoporphyrinogen IX oxidase
MKTLILYQSSTGNTQKYAEAIAEGIHGDVSPLKKFKWKNLSQYDTVVFGGWVMGNTIQGLNKFLQHWDDMSKKDVIVFAVGMSFPTEEGRHILIAQNLLDLYHLRFYQFRGSFNYRKLKFPYNFLMYTSLQKIAQDPGASDDQKALVSIKDHPIDVYDSEKVERVLLVLRTLAATTKTEEQK